MMSSPANINNSRDFHKPRQSKTIKIKKALLYYDSLHAHYRRIRAF